MEFLELLYHHTLINFLKGRVTRVESGLLAKERPMLRIVMEADMRGSTPEPVSDPTPKPSRPQNPEAHMKLCNAVITPFLLSLFVGSHETKTNVAI